MSVDQPSLYCTHCCVLFNSKYILIFMFYLYHYLCSFKVCTRGFKTGETGELFFMHVKVLSVYG